MTLKIKTLSIVLLFINASYLYGQTITGKIVDAWEQTPMPGCSILSNDKEIGTVGEDGRFTITKTPDMQVFTIRFISWSPIKIDATAITKDKDLGTIYMLPFYWVPWHDRAYGKPPKIFNTYWPNGNMRSSTAVKKERLHGPHTWYYESGEKQMEGQFYEGEPDDVWTFYPKDGNPVKMVFEKGVEVVK